MKNKSFEAAGITDNYLFQEVMHDKELCKELLEIILDVEIDHIEEAKTESSIKNTYQSKGIRVDAYVKDEQNAVYNIEMQASDISIILPQRIRYYQSCMDMNSLLSGQYYTELNKLIVIFICTFDPFGLQYNQYRFKNICLENSGLVLDDGRTIILLNSKGKGDSISQKLKNFLKYVNGEKTQGDSFIERLDAKLKEIKERKECDMNWVSLSAQMQDERREGRAEGRAEGRVETIVNTIKAGLTTLEAVKAANLASPSELKEIEVLLAKA